MLCAINARSHFGRPLFPSQITISREMSPMGTAGPLVRALDGESTWRAFITSVG